MTGMRRLSLTGLAVLLGLALLAALPCAAPAAGGQVMVFAAASTTNAMEEVGAAFTKQTGVKVVNSFAASSTLAKQIDQGAPAQVYLSANVKWMDYLHKAGAIDQASRFNLLRNRLVLIAPKDSPQKEVAIGPALDLAGLLGQGRLALGDPSHVPAGIYAQEALAKLGLWGQIKDKVAATASVRVALALVETGEVSLGIVYSTDAAISTKVKMVGRFPADSHRPIVYPVAMVKDQGSPAARQYLEFLHGAQAKKVFTKYGFLPF